MLSLRFDLEESQCEVTSGTTLPPWWKHSCLVDGPLQIDGLDGEEGGGAAGLDDEVDVVFFAKWWVAGSPGFLGGFVLLFWSMIVIFGQVDIISCF